MSKIRIDIITDSETGDISIDMKAECTLNELEVATGYLMAGLVSQSTTGIKVIQQLLEDIENGNRTADSEENNNIS